MTDRRELLWTLGMLAGATATSCRTPPSTPDATDTAIAQQPAAVQWRMATSWPPALDILLGAAQYLCDRVATITQGRFQITPTPAGEVSPPLAVMEAVIAGEVECGHTASHYGIDHSATLAFLSGLPFGLNAQQQNAWLFQGEGLAALAPTFERLGIVCLPAGNTGAQMGGWFRSPLTSLSDLQGVTMRIAGLGAEVMSRLGATVQTLAAEETVAALAAGTLSAAEWIGPHDDQQLGLHQVASYYYYPGWWAPAETLAAIVNQTAWEQLPRAFQVAFRLAATETNVVTLNRYTSANAQALQQLMAQGTEVTPFEPALLEAAQAATQDLCAEKAAADPQFRQVYDQWQAFRDRIQRWHTVNELSFATAVFPYPQR